MDRDLLIADIHTFKERRAALGSFDDGFDDFDLAERRRAQTMSDADLRKSLDAAFAEFNVSGGEHARRRFKVIRECFAARSEWLGASVGEATRQLEASIPPILAAAISRMEQALEFARNLGKSQFSFGAGDAITTSKDRTVADEKATARVEIAVQKLKALAFAPGDLAPQIAAIVAEADIASIWTSGLPTTPPEPVAFDRRRDKLRASSISDQVAAVIVADDEPHGRGRLAPVG